MSNASFLVYTNTPVDYRVTVKSASVDSVAEQAIELLARTCESRTDGGLTDSGQSEVLTAANIEADLGHWAL